jgi:hypothetical protein
MMERQLSSDPWMIANHLIQGQGYSACASAYFPFCGSGNQITAMREPVPVLMFTAAMLSQRGPMSGVLLETGLYMGMIYLIYFALEKRGRTFALTVAAVWALAVPVMEAIGDGSGDLEAAPWVFIGILFFQEARSSHRAAHWALAGLFLGLAALSRSVLLGADILLMIGLLFDGGLGRMRFRVRQMLILGAAVTLTVSPWAARNQIAFGAPILGTTLTGYNLYRHNYIVAEPDFHPHYVGAREAGTAVQSLVQESDLSGRENELQMQNFYMDQGVRLIASHPFQYLQLILFRASMLWFNSTVKVAYGEKPGLLDAVMRIEQVLILFTAAAGAWLNRYRLWPYSLTVLATCGAYILVAAQVRYLVEIMPLIAVLAASCVLPLKRGRLRIRQEVLQTRSAQPGSQR